MFQVLTAPGLTLLVPGCRRWPGRIPWLDDLGNRAGVQVASVKVASVKVASVKSHRNSDRFG